MSQHYTIGKVAPTPRGAYVATTTYNPLDIVTYNGSSYWVLQSCTGITPTNATYYQLIASKGNAGTNGSAATVDAGSITMLAYGSNPTVTNAGTANAAVFNFGIPYSPVSDNSVSTAKIVDASVTTNKIADGAVTTNEIRDGSVSYVKLGNNVKNLASATQEMFASIDDDDSFNSGDYVVYNPTSTSPAFYRFTADKASGAWDGTKVYLTNVGNELNNRVEKESFQNAGIHSASYTTIFDTATVSTTVHSNKEKPWVMLSATVDLINADAKYRITFDDVEYICAKQYWFIESYIEKGVGFLGNASLWGDVSGFTEEIYDAPFLVTSNMDTGTTYEEGLYLFTETAGQHTVKIEQITYDYTKLPTELVYGRSREAVDVVDNGSSSYFGYSIGTGNSLVSKRGTVAIGIHNIISGDSSRSLGNQNRVSGSSSTAVGLNNTITSVRSHALGGSNTVSGQESCAVGKSNTASGANSTAIGTGCTASGQYSIAVGTSSTASGIGSLALGYGSTASGTIATAIGQGSIAKNVGQLVFGMNNVADTSTNPSTDKGNFVEIVGNGANSSNRSNARTLDWSGNEYLAGSITLGKGTADEVTLTAAQLKQLLALL